MGTRVSFNSGFLGVYAQKWDCFVNLWRLIISHSEFHFTFNEKNIFRWSVICWVHCTKVKSTLQPKEVWCKILTRYKINYSQSLYGNLNLWHLKETYSSRSENGKMGVETEYLMHAPNSRWQISTTPVKQCYFSLIWLIFIIGLSLYQRCLKFGHLGTIFLFSKNWKCEITIKITEILHF